MPLKTALIFSGMRVCSRCGELLPLSLFQNHAGYSGGKEYLCKACKNKRKNQGRYKAGKRSPSGSNPKSTQFLGITIAETLFKNISDPIQRMPPGFRGYDFISSEGKKVDVKAACIQYNHNKYPCWQFRVKKNTVADFFACFAFENRKSLTPVHFWMIPGVIVNKKVILVISQSKLNMWSTYEKPIPRGA